MPKAFGRVCARHPEQAVEIWFQDEARFGQQGTLTRVWAERGTRPRACRQTDYEWVYLFGSVCPATGETHGGLLPWVNGEVMEAYLDDFSRQLRCGVHALLVMDSAGWHTSGALSVPSNVTLQFLPPKSPESNPAELPWREMRQKYLSNRVYPTVVEALESAVSEAWLKVIESPAAMRSLCGFDWITSIGHN